MTIIDPMHNLFLDAAKRMLKNVWIFSSDADLIVTQNCVDSMQLPAYVGRIP